MKRLKISPAFIFIIILQAGCASLHNTYSGDVPEDIRRMFVGTWQGEHVDNEGKLLRAWTQNRSEDGTYTITFYHYKQDGIYSSKQMGKWWIDSDRFYEIARAVKQEPDVYRFDILDENEIRFKSIVTDYEFVDRKMPCLRDATFL